MESKTAKLNLAKLLKETLILNGIQKSSLASLPNQGEQNKQIKTNLLA